MHKLCAAVVLCACAAAESPAGIETILAYQGTWKIEPERFNTPFSKAAKESSTLRNDCWRSAGYFVCDQFVNGESKDLIVFTYDAKDDTYNSYSVPAGGGESGSGKLIVKGNVWTFPWQDKQDGKTIYFQVVNTFTAPGTIEYRQESSEGMRPAIVPASRVVRFGYRASCFFSIPFAVTVQWILSWLANTLRAP